MVCATLSCHERSQLKTIIRRNVMLLFWGILRSTTYARNDVNRFYVTPKNNDVSLCINWFANKPPDAKNKLVGFKQRICRKLHGVTYHLAKHSLRVICATRLHEPKCKWTIAKERLGHKRVHRKWSADIQGSAMLDGKLLRQEKLDDRMFFFW